MMMIIIIICNEINFTRAELKLFGIEDEIIIILNTEHYIRIKNDQLNSISFG